MNKKRPIGHEIKVLSNAVSRKFETNLRQNDLDAATANHGRIMGYLRLNADKSVYQRDIEREFNISRSTVTNILQLMEKKGYIERVCDENDIRLRRLILTDAGYRIDKKILNCLEATEEQIVSGISESDLQVFYKVAEQIKSNCKLNIVKG